MLRQKRKRTGSCGPVTLKLVNKFNPDIETMEGASFMYVCLNEGVNFIQLRAISNYIEKRNKQNWNINLAIENINNLLIKWLKEKK